ncbi:MAG: heavy metal-associated domain-containing protein [Flavobacteriaceae bacterium]|nr:heavy metal-associated domain-containing protein [Flavobacteriaceae bacterium]
MKLLNKIGVLTLIAALYLSCAKTEDKKVHKSEILAQEVTADFKKVSLDIEGMTCEIGCARTIQSKLAKTEGVKLAEVNFSKKRGLVEYDANIITEKEIIATVEKIADGDLYKVTNTSEKE